MAVVETASAEVAAAVAAVPSVRAVAAVPGAWRPPAAPCDRTCGPGEQDLWPPVPAASSAIPAAILPAQKSSPALRAFQGKVTINFYFLAWVLLYSLTKLQV